MSPGIDTHQKFPLLRILIFGFFTPSPDQPTRKLQRLQEFRRSLRPVKILGQQEFHFYPLNQLPGFIRLGVRD